MTDCTCQGRIESARGIDFFSSGLFVAIAGAVAAAALCFLPAFEAPLTILPEAARWAFGRDAYGVGFCWCAAEHATEFLGCATVHASGVVRDRASMFGIRCADGLVCHQWSDQ